MNAARQPAFPSKYSPFGSALEHHHQVRHLDP